MRAIVCSYNHGQNQKYRLIEKIYITNEIKN